MRSTFADGGTRTVVANYNRIIAPGVSRFDLIVGILATPWYW